MAHIYSEALLLGRVQALPSVRPRGPLPLRPCNTFKFTEFPTVTGVAINPPCQRRPEEILPSETLPQARVLALQLAQLNIDSHTVNVLLLYSLFSSSLVSLLDTSHICTRCLCLYFADRTGIFELSKVWHLVGRISRPSPTV